MISETSITLLEQAQSGEPEAMSRLLDLIRPYVEMRIVQGRFGLDPDEVAQEVVVKVWKHLRGFTWEKKGDFRRWLGTIARNTSISRLRANARRKGLANQISEELMRVAVISECDETDNKELLTILWTYEKPNCSELHSRVFEDLCFNGLATKEVASKHDVTPENALMIRIRIGRKLCDLAEQRMGIRILFG